MTLLNCQQLLLFGLPISGGKVTCSFWRRNHSARRPRLIWTFPSCFTTMNTGLCPETLRRMPEMTMGAVKIDAQVRQTVRWTSVKISISQFDERHTTSNSFWNGRARVGLLFFLAFLAWCRLSTEDTRNSAHK